MARLPHLPPPDPGRRRRLAAHRSTVHTRSGDRRIPITIRLDFDF
ncbi:hypothetical protein ACFQ3Z_45555 [Streptomyces nogalater]